MEIDNQSRAASCEHLIIKDLQSKQIRSDRMRAPSVRLKICDLKGTVLGNGCGFVGRELDCPVFQPRQ